MRVISGSAKGVNLKTPDGMLTRPTADRVKEAIFSIIQFDLPGAKVLDLFGGTGQLGIEAISRGAQSAVFVDHQESACKIIRENLSRTKLINQAKVVRSDYLTFLKTCKDQFNIILLDPPYVEVFLENSLNFITEIDILQSDGIIVTERPAHKALSLEFSGFSRSRDYKYGNTVVTIYHKDDSREE